MINKNLINNKNNILTNAEFLLLVEILLNVQGINSGIQIKSCDHIYKYFM
jgi:hypothetical protein